MGMLHVECDETPKKSLLGKMKESKGRRSRSGFRTGYRIALLA